MQNKKARNFCGFIAIVGRPNVGKSSLLNKILAKKVSITSFKPQTTRYQILGIKTHANRQIIYVDTPGIHLGAKKALNKQMNKIASTALTDVNAIIFMVEALKWTEEDHHVCQRLQKADTPVFVAINKIDLVHDKERLLEFIHRLAQRLPDAHIVPLSVKKRIQIDKIEALCDAVIPESEFYFPEDQTVNHSLRFHVAEVIREKIIRQLAKELPYSTFVQIEQWEHKNDKIHIHAIIFVEREGQKAIVIGKNGQQLKEIGIKAREELERYCGQQICLKLWVKVNESWSDKICALKSLGYLSE